MLDTLQDGMTSSSSQLDTSLESSLSDDSQMPPEMVIAKFLLQVIGVATNKLHQVLPSFILLIPIVQPKTFFVQMIFSDGLDLTSTFFLQQELSHLLLFVIYMFQSGR